jgi:hypothetical protein
MALTTERYAEIDAELQQMRDYLAALAEEINVASSYKYGALHTSTVYALGAVARLRHAMEQSQEHQRIGEEIQRRWYGGQR